MTSEYTQTQSKRPTHVLARWGHEVFSGSESQVYAKLHAASPSSWSHAIRYEGYSIHRIPDPE